MANLTHGGVQPRARKPIPFASNGRSLSELAPAASSLWQAGNEKAVQAFRATRRNHAFGPVAAYCTRRVHSLGNLGRRAAGKVCRLAKPCRICCCCDLGMPIETKNRLNAQPSCRRTISRGMDPMGTGRGEHSEPFTCRSERPGTGRPRSRSVGCRDAEIPASSESTRPIACRFFALASGHRGAEHWLAAACCKPGGMCGSSPSALAWVLGAVAGARRLADFSRFSPSSIKLRRCCTSTGPIRISATWLAIVPPPR